MRRGPRRELEVVAYEVLADEVRALVGQVLPLEEPQGPDRVTGVGVRLVGSTHEAEHHEGGDGGDAHAEHGAPLLPRHRPEAFEPAGQPRDDHDAGDHDVARPEQGGGGEQRQRDARPPRRAADEDEDRDEDLGEEHPLGQRLEAGRLPFDDVLEHALAAEELGREEEELRPEGVEHSQHRPDAGPLERGELRRRPAFTVEPGAERQRAQGDETQRERPVGVDPHPHRRHQPARVEALLRGQEAQPERDEAEQQRSFDPEVQPHAEGEGGDQEARPPASGRGGSGATRARPTPPSTGRPPRTRRRRPPTCRPGRRPPTPASSARPTARPPP